MVCSKLSIDGGKAWTETLDGNELSFEAMSKANQALDVSECAPMPPPPPRWREQSGACSTLLPGCGPSTRWSRPPCERRRSATPTILAGVLEVDGSQKSGSAVALWVGDSKTNNKGAKMSKSRGNVLSAEEQVDAFGSGCVRYALLRSGCPPGGSELNLHVLRARKEELGLAGNLVHRTMVATDKWDAIDKRFQQRLAVSSRHGRDA